MLHDPILKTDARGVDTSSLAAIKDLLGPRAPLAAAISGSALYGTAGAASDDDIRCVFLPSKTEILTGRVMYGLDSNEDNKRLGAGDVDVAGVSLMRYLGLIGRMDMISTELLFAARESGFLAAPAHPFFDRVWDARDRLVAGNSNSAIGHARQRIGAFFPPDDASLDAVRAVHAVLSTIAGERIVDAPERIAEMAAIDGVDICAQAKDRFTPARKWAELSEEERATGYADGQPVFVVVAGKKIGATNPLHEAIRVVERPLKRAEENKRVASRGEAIAWKDAYQGVRLIYQAIELHETRQLTFPRPEAALLCKIRGEEMSADELREHIAEKMAELRTAETRYPFPEAPCEETTLALVCEGHEMVVRG